MKNLGRAIRQALRQRFTIIGIILSSLVVAFFWGANIGAVYPFVEVVVQNKSMHDWARERVAESEKASAVAKQKIHELEQQQDGTENAQSLNNKKNEIDALRLRIEAEQKVIATTKSLQPYIERYLPNDAFQTLVLIASFLVVGTIIKNLFLVANMLLVQRFSEMTTLELRNQVFAHTMKMGLGVFNKNRTGDLMSRFTGDIAAIGSTIAFLFGRALREPLKAAVCLLGALWVSWQLMLFSFMVAPLALILTYVLAKSIKRANRRSMEESSQFFRRLLQSFSGIAAVKANTMEKYECNRFRRTTREIYRKSMKIMFYHSLTKFSDEVLGMVVVSISILAGGYLVLNQETHLFGLAMTTRPMNLASLLMFYGFLIGASDPLRKLSGFVNTAQSGAAAADRIYPLLDRKPAIIEKENPIPAKNLAQPIVFDGVNFHYDKKEPVLRDINLKILCGETLAIVGPNGCGKTTLVNLIPRFYDPVDGEVRLGRSPFYDLCIQDLRRRIGIVTQQTILFDDTVLNNIRYGSPRATDEEVFAAAKKAYAHDFIMQKLEHGYDTNVGESGGRLSGGQKQRLSLARIILRDPQIMILDEATSQIDPESEQLIHKVLEKFIKDRTTFIITHRLSTLSLADRILVMNEGQIIDVGSHEELASRCELYQKLYQVSFKESA
ncbi:MAG: ABC transporter ATP-binding protein [Pirellulales bacterium]|nr:ABC transporter ATP-binding protein [Pirellulales bacterium]